MYYKLNICYKAQSPASPGHAIIIQTLGDSSILHTDTPALRRTTTSDNSPPNPLRFLPDTFHQDTSAHHLRDKVIQ